MSAAVSGLLRLRRHASRRRRRAAPAGRLQGTGAHRRRARRRPPAQAAAPVDRRRRAARAVPRARRAPAEAHGMGVHTQVVTSAVRPIPESWANMPRLQVCVSIDGLQPEHDVRRAPATYDRILKHIKGQHITVHCTITRQQSRAGYLTEFTEFWAALPDVKRIWFSLYTPQKGEDSPEMLRPEDRARVVAEIDGALRAGAEAARHDSVGRAGLPQAAAESGRVHLREDDGVPVGGLEADDHAVPVTAAIRTARSAAAWRRSASGAVGRLQARRRAAAPDDLQRVAQGRATCMRLAARRASNGHRGSPRAASTTDGGRSRQRRRTGVIGFMWSARP